MAVAEYTPPTPTNLTSPAQMSPADVDVPRTSPAEIVKATDNYPHLHGWDTTQPPVAHMGPEHPMRAQKSAEHHIQNAPQLYEHMQLFFLVVVSLRRGHRISGTTHVRARATHQPTPENGSSHGLHGRIALSWVLPQPYRAQAPLSGSS